MALVKLNASAMATKYRKWRSSIVVPSRFCNNSGHLAMILDNLGRNDKADRLHAATAGSGGKSNARVKKKFLVREKGIHS